MVYFGCQENHSIQAKDQAKQRFKHIFFLAFIKDWGSNGDNIHNNLLPHYIIQDRGSIKGEAYKSKSTWQSQYSISKKINISKGAFKRKTPAKSKQKFHERKQI